RVAASPDAIAVVDGGAWVSYAELNRRANRLAHSLRARGAEPEVPVGIFMDRSVELVVALLGVLKSGAAFVPLDPSYPDERLQFMAADTEISLAVTEERLSDRLPGNVVTPVWVDAEDHRLPAPSDANPRLALAPRNLAYVIYTSGSTGRPKGVAISHDSLSGHCQA
ncbi:MAG: AMP-binding protein, partial [bacterium]|nr:AMP-binding protein [bacterium]